MPVLQAHYRGRKNINSTAGPTCATALEPNASTSRRIVELKTGQSGSAPKSNAVVKQGASASSFDQRAISHAGAKALARAGIAKTAGKQTTAGGGGVVGRPPVSVATSRGPMTSQISNWRPSLRATLLHNLILRLCSLIRNRLIAIK